jgi:rhodanese-related sulfurtransferase
MTSGMQRAKGAALRAAAGAGAALALTACLGHGTARIDATCREMHSAVVYEMLKDNPSIPVLDVRRKGDMTAEEGKLAHTIDVPIDRLQGSLPSLSRYRETTVIVLGRDGETGRHACQLLSDFGFKYVIFVSDGAIGWFRNGLPAVTPSAAGPAPTPTPPRSGG